MKGVLRGDCAAADVRLGEAVLKGEEVAVGRTEFVPQKKMRGGIGGLGEIEDMFSITFHSFGAGSTLWVIFGECGFGRF